MIDRTNKVSVGRQAELLNSSRRVVSYFPKQPSDSDFAILKAPSVTVDVRRFELNLYKTGGGERSRHDTLQ